MLAIERHRRILNLVQNQGSVRTVEVAQTLEVAEETVRRDFEKLEQEGQLVRKHGGAVCVELNRRDLSFSHREAEHVEEKQVIAKQTLSFIEPGDTILFDASSTVVELAKMLPDMPITVLTGGLKVAMELVDRSSVQVVVTGGVLNKRSLACQGHFADQALECYHIKKAFLSCRGIDVERGFSESNEEQARLKRRMIDLADETYMLVDESKMGVKSSFFFAKPSDVKVVVTNQKPDPSICDALQVSGTSLFCQGMDDL